MEWNLWLNALSHRMERWTYKNGMPERNLSGLMSSKTAFTIGIINDLRIHSMKWCELISENVLACFFSQIVMYVWKIRIQEK